MGSSIDYIAEIGWQKYIGDGYYSFGYIYSYKRAGDILVEQLEPDALIYPIMFCYRQYLELLLKNIYMSNKSEEDYRKYIKKVSHNIIKSWKYINPILSSQIETKNLNFIEKVLNAFNKLDSSSIVFRYEYDKEMNRNIDDKRINIKKVKNDIEKIDQILGYTYNNG